MYMPHGMSFTFFKKNKTKTKRLADQSLTHPLHVLKYSWAGYQTPFPPLSLQSHKNNISSVVSIKLTEILKTSVKTLQSDCNSVVKVA